MKLGTLNYNPHSAEGEVKWNADVDLTKPDVVMLDVLGDWIAILTLAYNDVHKITYPEENKNDV
jgi:hypothetical protein